MSFEGEGMILRSVHRYAGIFLTAEDNFGKPKLGDLLKVVQPVIASNKATFLQMKSLVVGSYRMI